MPLRRAHTAAAAVVLALLAALCAPTFAHAAAQPRLIVGFQPTASASVRASSLGRAGVVGKSSVARLDAVVVRVAPGRLAAARRALLRRPGVAYVEVDHVARAYDLDSQASSGVAAAWRPSDRFLSQQWSLSTIGVEQAWEHLRGTGVTIAVVDTGVDYIHPDLAGRVDLGRDFVDGDADPMDVQGHGTHVAGTAAATADDGFGIAGVAPGARILAVRVLDADGAGNYSQVARGIVHAADRGAKVINLSLGGPQQSELLREAIDYATARGAIVTCATGNEGATSIGYPARYDSCIAIGATDVTDSRAAFSNRGSGIDLVAPGAQVLSSVMGGSHDSWDGTSMATPHVAGVAALLMSHGLGRRATADTLLTTTKDLGTPGYDTDHGFGRVDAAAAVDAAMRQPRSLDDAAAPTIDSLTVEPVRRTVKRQLKVQWKVRKRGAFARVGTTSFRGTHTQRKIIRRGKLRFIDTYRFSRGIVYRRRIEQVLTRRIVRTVTSRLPVTVAGSDDVGIDRIAVTVNGRIAGIDWSAGDGWTVLVPCTPGVHEFSASTWDAADNVATSNVTRRVTC